MYEAAGSASQPIIRDSTVAGTSVGSGPDCLGLNAGSAFSLLGGLGQVA